MARIRAVNRQYILFNLEEAAEELSSLIEGLRKGDPLNEKEFRIALKHAYHHLNSAWNSRRAAKEEIEELSYETFEKWQLFPADIHIEDAG